MTFQEYIDSKTASRTKGGKVTIKTAIRKRWQTRVVAQGLDKIGAQGASGYLDRYGKRIAAPKVIDLALCAQAEGCNEMAMAFWARAYELETGLVVVTDAAVSGLQPRMIEDKPSFVMPEFPEDLQPGKTITMQPIDATVDRSIYIQSDRYIGQPKRDGHRMLIFATGGIAVSQSRQLKISRDGLLLAACQEIAREVGPFVLDGEYWHEALDGSEWKTAAEAAEKNISLGDPIAQVESIYTIFKPLFWKGVNLLHEDEVVRLIALNHPTFSSWFQLPLFEICPTAYTEGEKAAMVSEQQLANREGEIWIKADTRYIGGKDTKYGAMTRTKYTTTGEFVVMGYTPTTAEGRPFGALVLAEEIDGQLTDVGKLGTGFDAAEQQMLFDKCVKEGHFKIVVEYQARTARGKLVHARYVNVVEPQGEFAL